MAFPSEPAMLSRVSIIDERGGKAVRMANLATVAAHHVNGVAALHSTLVVAGLFLLVELMAAQRGDVGDHLKPATAVREPILLGLMMLFGAASAAGLPPLPGFLGKLMILQSSHGLAAQAVLWTVVLVVGFLSMVGLARAGVVLF
jgi:multicomponent K+:H+ antiporter subunit D